MRIVEVELHYVKDEINGHKEWPLDTLSGREFGVLGM